MLNDSPRSKAQIAFEFLVVYSFIIIIFVVIFLLITSQRSSALNAQNYATLQLIAQDAASYLDQAVYSGSGYNATIPLAGSIGSLPYNLTISTTGVVIASSREGSQILRAQAYSNARNLLINGTLSGSSSNAVQLFVLPSTGYFKVANLNGFIFVDQLPQNERNVSSYLQTMVVGKTYAASLNGANSFLVENGFAPLNSANAFTITAWININAFNSIANQIIYSEGTLNGGATAFLAISPPNTMSFCAYNSVSGWRCTVTGSLFKITQNDWQFVALTENAALSATATYLNNFTGTTGTGLVESKSGINYAAIGINAISAIKGTGILATPFNGLIANLQIYNTTLNVNSIRALYYEGISGAPFSTKNLTAWWPLNGNGNDYSGYGSNMYPNNITYQTVEQIDAYPLKFNGTLYNSFGAGIRVPKALTGFATSNGLFSNTPSVSNYSNIGIGFYTSNGFVGMANATVSLYNGNYTLLTPANIYAGGGRNLLAWWPLDEGYGNTVYGFGSNGVALMATTPPSANLWSTINQNTTNFQVGNSIKGALKVNPASAYDNIVGTNSFTFIAWINARVNNGGAMGIFGDQMSIGGQKGWQIYESPTMNSITLSVSPGSGASTLSINGLPVNYFTGNWVMVAVQYSGSSGLANIYLNNTLMATGFLGTSSLAQTTEYVLGGAPNSGYTFGGLISNAQLYSGFLNQSQISSVYKQGVTGVPPSGVGLLSWWTLDGSGGDFGPAQNNATVLPGNTAFSFQNTRFSGYMVKAPKYAAYASPATQTYYKSQSTSVNLLSGSKATVTAWINPSAKQADPSYNMYFSYGPAPCLPTTLQLGIEASGIPDVSTCPNDFIPANGPTVTFNSWNFVATIVNSRSVSIFVNGVWLNGTLNSPANIQPGGVFIGAGTQNNRFFNGSIADVRVYNNTLNPQTILQIYQAGPAPNQRINISSG